MDEFRARHLTENLPDAGSRVRWTFFLDSAHDTADRRRGVEQLLGAGGRAAAVLVIDDSSVAPPGLPAYSLESLGRRGQQAIAKMIGAPPEELAKLRRIDAIDTVLSNPRLLVLMLRALRTRPGPVPRDLAGALDRLIDGALVDAGVREEALAAERTRAAVLAYELTKGHTPAGDAEDVTEDTNGDSNGNVLVRSGLLHAAALRFVHPIVRDHLAIEAVLLGAVTVDGTTLLGEPRLRPIALALAAGRTAPARSAVRDDETGAGTGAQLDTAAYPLAGSVLDAAVARLEVSASMVTLVDPTDVVAAAGHLPLAHGPMFSFPAGSLAALELLASAGRSGRALPPAARALADRFISSAVVNGTPLERRQAVTVLGAASDDVAAGAAELALRTGQGWIRRAAATQTAERPGLFARLSVAARARAVWGALSPSDDNDMPGPVWLTRLTRTGSGLVPALGRLRLAASVVAALTALVSLPGLIGTLVSWSDGRGSAIAALTVIVGVLCALPVVSRLAERDRSDAVAVGMLAMGVAAGLYLLLGVPYLISVLADVLSGHVGTAAHDLFFGYVLTWFPAFVGAQVIALVPGWPNWLLPQAAVARFAWDNRGPATRRLMRSRRSVRDRRRAVARGYRGRLADRTLSGDDLLAWITACHDSKDVARVLRRLRQAPAEALLQSAPVLGDLNRAVEHVGRFVPETTRPIPPAVWAVGPAYATPGFLVWLVGFDLRRPGRLYWLASAHRDELSRILARAHRLQSTGDGGGAETNRFGATTPRRGWHT